MKKIGLSRMFILLLLSSVSLMSCSEDDDGGKDNGNGNGNGNATYDGTEINLDQGFISYNEEYEELYNFDIVLFSDDFEIDFVNEEIEGTGEIVNFELWTDQSSGLKNGTYTMSEDESDFALTYAQFAIDFNYNEGDEGDFFEATDGEVTVSKSGSTYTLDFDLTFENGKSLTGTYVGNLIEVDEDED